MDALAREAKAGSVTHARAFAELGGLNRREKSEKTPKRRGKSLGRRLTEELHRERDRAEARAAKTRAVQETVSEEKSEGDEGEEQATPLLEPTVSGGKEEEAEDEVV